MLSYFNQLRPRTALNLHPSIFNQYGNSQALAGFKRILSGSFNPRQILQGDEENNLGFKRRQPFNGQFR